MTTLYICEKPSQGRDIARMVGASQRDTHGQRGNGVIVTWCLGHLLAQAPPEHYHDNLKPWRLSALPVVPQQWVMQPVQKTKPQLDAIARYLKEASEVIIATDADREGDVIGREVLTFFNYQGAVKRLWLSALDDASIKKALANMLPGEKTYPLYQAGLGRQRADWLIGMNMTMAASSLLGDGNGVRSVGRVQTPTLKLVVDRDRQIANFTPQPYFELFATFKGEKGEVSVKWQAPDEFTDEAGRCLKKETLTDALSRIEGQAARVAEFSDTDKKTPPPLGLSLSSLQKLCNAQFSLSAKQTLTIAQSLYEKHKATTYPRTDCGYLPESQQSDSASILANIAKALPALAPLVENADSEMRSPIWNDQKITAHHAIIPTTNATIELSKFSVDEKRVYELIVRYYLAQFLGNFHYTQRKVIIQSGEDCFEASSNETFAQGWKKALPSSSKKDEGLPIPEFSLNEAVSFVSSNIIDKQTKAPSYFTEGALISAMKQIAKYVEDTQAKKTLKESAGIGTEATRANIIETLLTRAFLKREGKQIRSTPTGQALIDALPVAITDPITTAQWEQALDEIASGEGTRNLEQFCSDQLNVLEEMLNALSTQAKTLRQAKGEDHACPSCQAPMRRRARRDQSGYFWGCSTYPDCKQVMNDENGKPVASTPKAPVAVSDITCPTCEQHPLAKRQGKKGYFWGCSGFPNCKAIFWDREGAPDLANPPAPRG